MPILGTTSSLSATAFGFVKGGGDAYYRISESTTTINEGSSVVFTVITGYVDPFTTLYWTLNVVSGTVDVDDFLSGSTSGSIVTGSNGIASLSITPNSDYKTEGTESFQVQIRTGSVSGPIVATSNTVSIVDSSVPTYSVSPSTTNISEGSSVTFTVNTNGTPNGSTLYYTLESISGTVNSSDFSSGSLTGSFSISGASGTFHTGGSGTISYTLSNDLLLEGSESFRLQIRTGSISGTIVATSDIVSINDTSVPTYSVSPSTTSVNEGSSVTFTITTAGVPNGTTLYYTLSTISGTINSSDFSSGSTSGSFTVNSNSGSVSFTLANDLTTEGNEQFYMEVRTGSVSGTIVATSSTVTINDTSLDPSYAVSPSTTTVDEGSSLTFTITTTGVPNGTTLYYTLSTISGNVNDADFSSGSTSGSFTINSNSGSVSFTLANDITTGEGNEQFQFQVRTGSIFGTIRATSSTVTIRDTSSTAPITYAVLAGGGGGGGAVTSDVAAGGGGAGGYLSGTFNAVLGTYYFIGIGAGGSGGYGFDSGYLGNPSTFGPIDCTGGGGGTGYNPSPQTVGGSGGGGCGANGVSAGSPGISGQGRSGGPGGSYPDPLSFGIGGGGGGGGIGADGQAGSSNGGQGGHGIYAAPLSFGCGGGGGSNYPGATGGAGGVGFCPTGFCNLGGPGGFAPSAPGGSSTGQAGSNAYAQTGSGGGGAAVRFSGPALYMYGGAGSGGFVELGWPSAYTATISGGLVYSTPSPVNRKFTSGFGSIVFNLA